MGKSLFFAVLFLSSFAAQAVTNPDISANALMLYRNTNREDLTTAAPANGFGVDEIELQFTADVDQTARLNVILAAHQEITVTNPPLKRESEWHMEPEEAYAETLSLPSVTLKFGKFKAAFGKHNQLHTHAYPFIDAPLAQEALLGEEGFADNGVSAAVLLPTSWFSELTVQSMSGKGLDYFDAPSGAENVLVGRFRNLWDLSDSATFELGLSGAGGKNADEMTTSLSGVDFTLKWRPVEGGRERSLTWTTEAIDRKRGGPNEQEKGVGLSSYVQYQFAPRWWAQVRTESLEMKDQDPTNPDALPETQRRNGVLIGFMPSEFSGYRLSYDRLEDGADEPEHRLLIQFNYSIGAHPAHAY